jgi:hypothetical protein
MSNNMSIILMIKCTADHATVSYILSQTQKLLEVERSAETLEVINLSKNYLCNIITNSIVNLFCRQ